MNIRTLQSRISIVQVLPPTSAVDGVQQAYNQPNRNNQSLLRVPLSCWN